jgi:hypothetical protein
MLWVEPHITAQCHAWVGLAGWFCITVPAVLCGLLSVLPPVGRAGPADVA